ncbi:lytic polysaccharide monooxygenase [Nonomuraea sp. NPDC048826]|uniref:lytic polysaccharide monooxygenase auxiliary activity family 9 protein n=1 Tax=Nonomuraea sp. NPDC048826 TaxID=3364347 RepID=UPI00371016B4
MRQRIAGVAVAVLGLWAAGSHGALEAPVSRAAACGEEGAAKAPACAAAVAASDGELPEAWDNLRVPDVGGRDREVIPDGELCSAGLDAYRGLDLPRADWPATTLTPGDGFTFRYRGTIPHQGSFHLYVTADGYDPARPLGWDDLEPRPFMEATDPPMKDGSYVMDGSLPEAKSGRHLIYTIWRNSDTPDTYYSCSDVVFTVAARPRAAEPEGGRLPWLAGGGLLALAAGLAVMARRHDRRR